MPSTVKMAGSERFAHAAERRAFDLIGGGETLERADVPHAADGKRRDGAARGVNADKKSSQIMNTALRISVNTTPNSMQ